MNLESVSFFFILILFAIGHSPVNAIEAEEKDNGLRSMFKRSLVSRNVTDVNNCIHRCFNLTPIRPKFKDGNSLLPVVCYYQKFRFKCIARCPDSEAKTLVLDSFASTFDICNKTNMTNATMVDQVSCGFNITEDVFEICNEQCKLDDFTQIQPSVTQYASSNRTVLVSYESDGSVVKKTLTSVCIQGTCHLNCRLPIVRHLCGEESARDFAKAYRVPYDPIAKLYLDLKVIDSLPDECNKFTAIVPSPPAIKNTTSVTPGVSRLRP